MNIELTIFVASFIFLFCAATLIRIWVKKAQEARCLNRYNAIIRQGMQIPPTLHPVFDATRCIGSGACTKVCPQGDDVVGRIHGRGVLIDPSMCIGHGRCAASCPMGAIRLVFGSAQRGVDIPHLSPQFETNVKGLYITGELGGMGLIANAVRQAKEGISNIAQTLPSRTRDGASTQMVDVVIVGAGPAGITSALAAMEHGLTYRLFDKEAQVGGAILQYPRSKIVMTRPMQLPLVGNIRATTMSKEGLVALFNKVVTRHNIRLEGGVYVEEILQNADGTFFVTAGSETVHTRTVMLAIGRRGVPRKLGVAGEQLPHVCYSMIEPDPFVGRRVLVVGGGNSAVETALMLAEEKDTIVQLSYRDSGLTSANAANRDKFDRAVKDGKINALPNSTVSEITQTHVQLLVNGEIKTVPVDAVIIQIGGELPTAMLHRIGVSIERHFGEEIEQHRKIDNAKEIFTHIRNQRRAKGLQNFHVTPAFPPVWLKWVMGLLGVAALLFLFYAGREYYLASDTMRRDNDALRIFSASGAMGHRLGIWAAVLMLINVSYFARKELRTLSRLGNIQTWMFFHQLSGLIVATMVLLHTGLILNNAFALALYISLGIVVGTGIIGRTFFTMVPIDPRGRPLTHAALVDLSARMKKRYTDLFGRLDQAIKVNRILDLSYKPQRPWFSLLFRLFTIWPYRYVQLMTILFTAQKRMKTAAEYRSFKRYSLEMARLRLQLEISPRIKGVLQLWRSGHALLALMTITLVVIHIFVEIWLGY